MDKAFTYAECRGTRLYVREAWRNGDEIIRRNSVVTDYPFEMFLPASSAHTPDSLSIFSKPLSRIELSSVEALRTFCDDHDDLHGMEDPVVQWLAKEYPKAPEVDLSLFVILNVDIEVAHDNGFPEPAEAKEEILSITFKPFGKSPYTLGTKKSNRPTHLWCSDETHLITTFIEHWEALSPDIFTGWNSTFFDMAYLVNRIRNVLGENYVKRLSPFRKQCRNPIIEREDNDQVWFEIVGVTQIDYLELYKKFCPERRESYRLDFIANLEIKERKISYEEYGNSLMRLWRGQPIPSRKEGCLESQHWEAIRQDIAAVMRELEIPEDDSSPIDIEDVKTFDAIIQGGEIEPADLPHFLAKATERVQQLSYDLFVDYNDRDVILVEKIDDKLAYMENLISVAYMVRARLSDAVGTIKPWDAYMYRRLLDKGMQPPPHRRQSRPEMKGGFVKEPKPGLRRWVVTLDLASLYPNIVRTLNMSPETKVCPAGDWVIDRILAEEMGLFESGCAIACNGSMYDQSSVGLMPEAMGFLLDERSVVKSEMKSVKKEKEKAKHDGVLDEFLETKLSYAIRRLDSRQKAVKVLANGGYGAMASIHFRYFDLDIAEGITTTGQTVIKFVANRINAHLNKILETQDIDYVIGSDTDSCMVDISVFMDGYIEACGMPERYEELIDVADAFVKTNLEEDVLVPAFVDLSALLGSRKSTLSMKREAIADRGLFRAKKHYVLQVWDNEGVRFTEPELKMVGIETARTTTPRICRENIEEALKIILNGEERELKDAFKRWKLDFMSAPYEEIAFPRGVSETEKWDESDAGSTSSVFGEDEVGALGVASIKKGAPPQVKAALSFNFFLQKLGIHHRDPITPGSKLKFLYLRKGNPTGYNVIGFVDDFPVEFDLAAWVDKDLQFQKALATPVESFTSLVGWDVVSRAVLTNELFTEDVDYEKQYDQKVSAPVVKTPRPAATERPTKAKKAVSKKAATIEF